MFLCFLLTLEYFTYRFQTIPKYLLLKLSRISFDLVEVITFCVPFSHVKNSKILILPYKVWICYNEIEFFSSVNSRNICSV